MLNYGTFEGHPAIWSDREAWVLYDGTDWCKIHHSEILQGASPMPEAEFKATFQDIPEMPKAAFQAGE